MKGIYTCPECRKQFEEQEEFQAHLKANYRCKLKARIMYNGRELRDRIELLNMKLRNEGKEEIMI